VRNPQKGSYRKVKDGRSTQNTIEATAIPEDSRAKRRIRQEKHLFWKGECTRRAADLTFSRMQL